jgi:hypothetical protein
MARTRVAQLWPVLVLVVVVVATQVQAVHFLQLVLSVPVVVILIVCFAPAPCALRRRPCHPARVVETGTCLYNHRAPPTPRAPARRLSRARWTVPSPAPSPRRR